VVWQADDPRAALEAYVQLYVREEIRLEALVRNLPAFLRFLPMAALFHGRVINIAGLARDAATARTTIEGYIGILPGHAGGELPRLTRRILVYLGDRHLRTEDGIDVWPLNRFAAAVADRSLWL
jgi:hypothetical protein